MATQEQQVFVSAMIKGSQSPAKRQFCNSVFQAIGQDPPMKDAKEGKLDDEWKKKFIFDIIMSINMCPHQADKLVEKFGFTRESVLKAGACF